MFGLSDTFNAATWFVDRNIHEGRGAKVAIECGDERVTYQQVLDRVYRVGNALREELDVRLDERGARTDRDGLMKPYAYVVLRQGTTGTPDLAAELQQFVRERLADYKRPRWVEFIAELPKTATGEGPAL